MTQEIIRNVINDTLYSHPGGFDFKRSTFAFYGKGNWQAVMDFLLRAEAEGYVRIVCDPRNAADGDVCVHGIKCIPESFRLNG